MNLAITPAAIILRHTRLGRYTYAIGGNESAAKLSGVRVKRVTLLTYVISGFCSAIVGLIVTSQLVSAHPATGESWELRAIAAVVLGGTSLAGGRGAIGGTIIGAFVIGVLTNGMILMGVTSFWQQIIMGIVIVLAVVLDQVQQRLQEQNEQNELQSNVLQVTEFVSVAELASMMNVPATDVILMIRPERCRIIAGLAGQCMLRVQVRQLGEGVRQTVCTQLGAATAAVRLVVAGCGQPVERRLSLHGGQLTETRHKFPVYTVLPAPYPFPCGIQEAFIRGSLPASQGDQRQESLLGSMQPQLFAQ